MNDEQIQSLLREYYLPIAMERSRQLAVTRSSRRRWWLSFATTAVTLATALSALVLFSASTPARALDRVNEVLKGVGSFQVKMVSTLGPNSTAAVSNEIQPGLIITHVDRDPMSALIIADEKSFVLIPKGSKFGYIHKRTRVLDSSMPRADEEPIQFVLRQYWLGTIPTPQGSDVPRRLSHEVDSSGRQISVIWFEDPDERFVDGFGTNYVRRRFAQLRFDERTSLPIELVVSSTHSMPVRQVVDLYEFSYEPAHAESLPAALPKGISLIDVDKLRERKLEVWRKNPLMSFGNSLQIFDAFSSPIGWTSVVTSTDVTLSDRAVDQLGGLWLISPCSNSTSASSGFCQWIVTPLEPSTVPDRPVLTLSFGRQSIRVSLPKPSTEEFPDWMPLVESMSKLFKYRFMAEGIRAAYYKSIGDEKGELRWRKEEIRIQQRLAGNMILPSVERVKQLERRLRP